MRSSYIPTLDGWRAVAISLVLVCHGLNQRAYPWAEPLGLAGVLLFFSISGFLITSRLLDEERQSGAISFRRFYLRRAFRILPPALVYLATVAVLGLAGVIPFSANELAKSFFFIRNYAFLNFVDPASWYSVHFWSLSVEEHFYLIWPALLILFGARRARWVVPGLAVCAMLWRTLDEKHQFVIGWFHAPFLVQNLGRTDYIADVLLWGCALAIWLGPGPWKSPLPRGNASIAALAIAVFIGFDLLGGGVSHGRDLVYLLFALLVGIAVTTPQCLLSRFLEWVPLKFVGRISYSLYLWQQLFFHGDNKPLSFQQFPLNLALIFACACLSYYLVERPMIRLGHRVATHRRLKGSGRQEILEPAVICLSTEA